MRIVFAGTPGFAVPALRAAAARGEVVAVYTQPDRPAGRGRQVAFSPVKAEALERGIEVFQPATLRSDEAQEQLRALEPDLLVVVAYGLILPCAVLEIPRFGCWNVHASLLPRWRGAAPIQRAIEAGDAETGVCLMWMAEGLDTGPVLLSQSTPIGAEEPGGELHDRLADLGAPASARSRGRSRPRASPTPASSTRPRRCWTGRSRRRSWPTGTGPSTRGRWPRPNWPGSGCASMLPARWIHPTTPRRARCWRR